MLDYTKIALLLFALFAFSARTCVQNSYVSIRDGYVAPLEEKTNVLPLGDNSFEECSAITREVLIRFCGSCHQSTLDSHKIEAIKFFDLDLGVNWHNSLSEENLPGIARRIENKNEIIKQHKEAITTFLKLKELQLKK